MSEFFIKDGKSSTLDIVGADVLSDLPDVQSSFEYAKRIREHNFDTRRITSRGTYYGGKDYQLIAHIPGRVAKMLDLTCPGWDLDETEMRRILAEQPGCKVLPEESHT